jgi:hypothetical protein
MFGLVSGNFSSHFEKLASAAELRLVSLSLGNHSTLGGRRRIAINPTDILS